MNSQSVRAPQSRSSTNTHRLHRRSLVLAAAAFGSFASIAPAANVTWDGGGAADNWSDALNWSLDIAPIPGADALFFAGTTRLTPNNDTAANSIYNGITFNAGAGSFNLGGNAVTLGGNVTNSSSNAQTISMGLTYNANRTIAGGTAGLTLSGPLHNSATTGTQVVTLSGQGTLTGAVSSVGTGTNGITNLTFDGAGTVWNWRGNASSVIAGQAAFRVNNGATLNYGSATDAPSISFGDVLESEIGFAGNGTFNMINGSILFDDRMNTRNTAVFNQTGGTFQINDQFQASNAALVDQATFNLSGGLFDIRNNAGTGGGTFFLASRGHGILNVNAGGNFKAGTLDVSRSINNGTTGVVNLNGGVIEVNKVSTATANVNTTATNNSTATFNFNGGTLRAREDNDLFLSHSEDFDPTTAAHINVPLNVFVKAGGAIIDTVTFALGATVGIKHDPALGATPDGGLTVNGTGSLTFAADNTYTGGTTINNGTVNVGNYDGNAGTGLGGSLGTGNVTLNNATLNFNRTGSVTVGGNITGTGTGTAATVGHFGPGTVILSGNNTYTGATDVTGGGTLVVNGSTVSGEAVNVTGTIGGTGSTGNVTITGGTNGVRPGATPADGIVGTLTMNSLAVTNADFRMDLVGVGTSDLVNVTNAATFAAGGASTFTAAFASAPAQGVYTLLSAGSPIVYDHTPTLIAPTGTRTSLTLDTASDPSKVLLNIVGSAANLVWTGSNDTTTWDKAILNNWSGHADNKFYNGDTVTFNESSNATINITELVEPSSVTFNNSSTNYTINGQSIGGQFTTVTKNGTGSVQFNNGNTYGAGTVINAGSIIASNPNALGGPTASVTLNGTGSLNVRTSMTVGSLSGAAGTTIHNTAPGGGESTLTVNATTDGTFDGLISNGNLGMALTKTGPGALVLTNNNTYTGWTNVNGGILQLGNGGTTGSIGSTIITANSSTPAGQRLVINRSDSLTFGAVMNAGLGFTKAGTNTVTLTGDNSYTGATVIEGGSLVMGTGGGSGLIGTGPVTNNGSLVINRTGGVSLPGIISGSGTLTQNAAALTTISGTNTYTGATTINAGKVTVNTFAALGAQGTTAAPGASITVANGATLDIGGVTPANAGGGFGPKELIVAGNGEGFGVLTNSGLGQQNAFQRVTLSADATFGSNTAAVAPAGRFDIRAGQVSGANFAKLNLNGNTLTKTGINQFSLVAVDVNPGNIIVNGGIFAAETTTNLSNTPGSSITLNTGTQIQFFNVAAATAAINRQINVNGNVTTGTSSPVAQPSTVGSAWQLNGHLTFGIANNNTGSLTLNGNITETSPSSVTKTGVTTGNVATTTTLNGSLGWTGNTTVNNGELILGGTSNLLTNGAIAITAPVGQPAGKLTMNTAVGGRTLKGTSLTVDGILAMNDNDFIVDYTGTSPEFTLRDKVKAFRDSLAPGGPAFTSGISFTPGANDRVIAVAEKSEWSATRTEFNGIAIDNTTIIGKHTYYGDANLDGKVDSNDYVAVDVGLGSGDSWVQGDFNFSGTVTSDDYVAIDTNLGKGVTNGDPLAIAELKAEMVALHTAQFGDAYVQALAIAEEFGYGALVPEPGALSLVGIGAAGLLGRRRRRA